MAARNGAGRCRRSRRCRSVHRRRRTPAMTMPWGTRPQKVAASSPQASPAGPGLLCQPTSSSWATARLAGASSSVTACARAVPWPGGPAARPATSGRRRAHRTCSPGCVRRPQPGTPWIARALAGGGRGREGHFLATAWNPASQACGSSTARGDQPTPNSAWSLGVGSAMTANRASPCRVTGWGVLVTAPGGSLFMAHRPCAAASRPASGLARGSRARWRCRSGGRP
jgi:hypothetical protein